jgi:hypothetical protein
MLTPCPKWCVTPRPAAGPGEPGHIHRTIETSVDLPGHAGYVSTRGGVFGPEGTPPEVVMFTGSPEAGGPFEDLYVPARDAGKLAAVLDALSYATPEQHRELAAGIRQAAAETEPEAGS